MALEREGVGARFEEDVGDETVADGRAVNGQVHGYVAEVEGHDRGVGDADLGDEVGVVSEEFVA